jgi:long-chain acyl-CoA synthetase
LDSKRLGTGPQLNTEPGTILELLAHSFSSYPEKPALAIRREGAYEVETYGGLLQKYTRLGAVLREQGMKKGDRAAILCENGPEWAVAYLGTLACGGIVVGIDTRLTRSEMENIVSHSEPKLVLSSTGMAQYRLHEKTILLQAEELRAGRAGAIRESDVAVSPEDVAMLVYTSGTTGAPKAVMLTHRNITSNVLAAYEALPAGPRDRFLSVLPLTHMFELVGGLLGPLYCGAAVTYLESINTAAIKAAMKETRMTVMLSVPLLFKLFYKKIVARIEDSIQPVPLMFAFNMKMARASRNLRIGRLIFRRVRKEFGGRLRYFISGAAPLTSEVEAAFQSMGMPIYQGYGLTEASPIVSVNTPGSRRIGSVGRPIPGTSVRISQDGEIVVRGPGVMAGYYKDPDATSSVLTAGELHTGDIGFLDRDGFLFITGRKKTMIVTAAGKNVFPEEVELVLGRSSYVREICVVGRKDKEGETPFAFIIPDYDYFGFTGAPRDDANVRKVLRSEVKRLSSDLAEHERVSDFAVFKGEFPKTTTRKIKRHELARMVGDRSTPIEVSESLDDLARELRSLIAGIADVPEESVALGSDLYMDLGIDSLLKVELLTAVESRCGIRIPDEASYRISTFEELVELVRTAEQLESSQHLATSDAEESYEFLKERTAARKLAKRFFSLFFRLFSKWYFDLETSGAHNVIGLRSFVITPNHNSLLDVPIVLSSLPCSVAENVFSPAAKDYFFDRHPLRRWFIELVFDAFPFDRHGNFIEGLRKCKRTIEEGRSLILFPEGTRSVSGEIQPFKIGLGALALDLGIPIVPTYIKGIHGAFGKGMLFPRPRKIEVRFGRPILMERYVESKSRKKSYDIYSEIAEDVKQAMLRLM